MTPSPTTLHITELTETPLLSLAEEQHLTQSVHHAQQLTKQLENNEIPPEKTELAQHLITQGEEARQQLINANTRLVISIAKNFTGQSLSFSDLIQEGILGLMHATTLFDPRKGYKFSTYATNWIKQRIHNALANTDRPIRITRHVTDELRLMRQAIDRLIIDNTGEQPSIEEIALEMGPRYTQERVEELLAIQDTRVVSLDAPVKQENDPTTALIDMITPADDAPTMIDELDNTISGELINDALAELQPKPRAIVQLTYGLNKHAQFTTTEIGAAYGMHRSGIAQALATAKKRLQRNTQLRNWVDENPDSAND